MVVGLRTFLAESREESTLLPAVSIGYIYTKTNKLKICPTDLGIIDFRFTGLQPSTYFLLAICALVSGSLIYIVTKLDTKAPKIRDSTSQPLKVIMDISLITHIIFLFLAPLLLLIRACNGDLISNALLFIQGSIILTTIWVSILSVFSDEVETKGLIWTSDDL